MYFNQNEYYLPSLKAKKKVDLMTQKQKKLFAIMIQQWQARRRLKMRMAASRLIQLEVMNIALKKKMKLKLLILRNKVIHTQNYF